MENNILNESYHIFLIPLNLVISAQAVIYLNSIDSGYSATQNSGMTIFIFSVFFVVIGFKKG